jgi:hypothetical protein
MRWLVWVGLAVGLAGCAPTPEQLQAADQAQCAAYGFKPGKDGFAGCMMQQDQNRRACLATQWEAMTQAIAGIGNAYHPPVYAPSPPPAWTPNCFTVPSGNVLIPGTIRCE